MVALIQFLALAAIVLAVYLAYSLYRSVSRSTALRQARSFWWQFNQAWAAATSGFWTTTTTPCDPQEQELARLLNGDYAKARRLAKAAGSADRAITQLLRDRR